METSERIVQDGLLTVAACPVCGGSRFSPSNVVYTAPYLMVQFASGLLPVATIARYIHCDGCGLIMLSPRMTDARIKEYYSSGVYRQTLGLSQVAMDDDEQQRAREIVDFLEDHGVKPTVHCDIGSSRGYLLDQTNALFGCTTIGWDLNLGYVDVPHEGEGKPDLVTAIHVLEHTTDPKKSLNDWAAMTTRWLLVEVPGEGCKGGPLRWAHTYYFPKPLLERMVIETGMKIIVSETTETQHTRILATK